MIRHSLFACLSLLFLCTSCKDITHVQTGYVSDRDDCRSQAENGVGVYSQPDSYPLSGKEKNTALLQLFCECMKGRDWAVAGCKKPAKEIAATPAPQQQQPTVVVVQSPSPGAGTPPPVAQAVPLATKHKKKKTVVCQPAPTCTAPATDSGNSPQLQEIINKE